VRHRPRGPISGETLAAIGFFVWSLATLVLLVALLYSLAPHQADAEHWRRLSLLLAIGAMLCFGAGLLLIVGAVRWALGGVLNSDLREIKARLAERDQMLYVIAERLNLSDVAKRIANRESDVNFLRQAIHEDVSRRAFDSALVLVNELAQTFGFRYEAESFREQIAQARKSETEQKVAAGTAQIDAILERHDWDLAFAEAAKLVRLYPDAPSIRALDKRVRDVKEQHKKDLERQFLEAAQRDDVDRAVELLKDLDKYLNSAEAEPFRETARGVIGKKRDNLGVQFKLAVSDKEWTQAVRIGEQIIREFPNTKMADEVRSMLDLLRERAAGEQAARVPSPRPSLSARRPAASSAKSG
jgi:hypothetical protein